jgi:hypothetical protein
MTRSSHSMRNRLAEGDPQACMQCSPRTGQNLGGEPHPKELGH